jgi:hypothetical protein
LGTAAGELSIVSAGGPRSRSPPAASPVWRRSRTGRPAPRRPTRLAGGTDAADVALERWIVAGAGCRDLHRRSAALVVPERADYGRARAPTPIADTRLSFRADGPRDACAPAGFAAAGGFELLAALERAGSDAPATVTRWCPSGHGAAVVVQRLA